VVFVSRVVSFNSYADNPSVLEYCNSLYENKCRSPHLLSMLVDICEESLKLNQSSDQINLDKALKVFHLSYSKLLITKLQ